MANGDGTLWIVFSGKIPNFEPIRGSLENKGYRFKTQSDTEVIVRQYEERRDNGVSELNGIFGFAIWDGKNQTLFLARDHMGVKPLYYAVTEGAFLFASETKAILKSGLVELRCGDESVFEYFSFRRLSGGKTLFRGVRSLLPAHTLNRKDGDIDIRRYWSAFPEWGRFSGSPESAAEQLSELIEDAARLQLVSDVPLGTFCSGGVDSSLITAFAAKLTEQ